MHDKMFLKYICNANKAQVKVQVNEKWKNLAFINLLWALSNKNIRNVIFFEI